MKDPLACLLTHPLLSHASQRFPLARLALPKAVVQYEYAAQSSDELTIQPGDVLEIVLMEVPDDPHHAWWRARLNGQEGLVPKEYVALQ